MSDPVGSEGAAAGPAIIVGVGASAGGLEAFKKLLSALPSDTGMAFLLVQHLDPAHESLLPELLSPRSKMAVREAEHGLRVEPDTVYIIRPDTALAVEEGRIQISRPTLERGVRLPVDHLFRSLARSCSPRAAGIVLSGAGADGSAGLRDLKASGGLVLAQDPGTSGQPGMPQSAIDTGCVDFVLPISEMPGALGRFASLPPEARPETRDAEGSERLAQLDERDIGRLASLLQAQVDFDLRMYKPGTVERRVLRRIGLAGFADDVSAYLEHLGREVGEQQSLVRDLLIRVTEFFRDPDALAALRTQVIDPLVKRIRPGDTVRVWVPGCATGEEAYSPRIPPFPRWTP